MVGILACNELEHDKFVAFAAPSGGFTGQIQVRVSRSDRALHAVVVGFTFLKNAFHFPSLRHPLVSFGPKCRPRRAKSFARLEWSDKRVESAKIDK